MSRRLGLQAMGLATPLGIGKGRVAENLFRGTREGLVENRGLIADKTVPVGTVTEPLPPVPDALRAFDCRNNRMMLSALMQIAEPISDAVRRYGAHRIAVLLGTSTSGIAESESAYAAYKARGEWPAQFSYSQHEAGGLPEFTAHWLGVSGPAYAMTTACSSSAKVFASARRLIAAGICDAAVVGGADTLCRLTLNGFDSLEALSPGLCNPFSVNRNGINIGEGAAAFLVTAEPATVALLGAGETSDAYHISAPDPDGKGAMTAMQQALDDAGLAPDEVSYLNLHGTATPLNDAMESRAVAGIFPAGVPCSSTKAMTGHMLGAAGGCEAAFLWLALHPDFGNGRLPPHLWDGEADPDLPPLALVAPGDNVAGKERTAMLSSSFAFGGSNVALALGRGWSWE